jgi:hypothetical protein
MTTFDDPIFDPWSTSEETARPVRWRSSTASRGVPVPRPVPPRARVVEPVPDPVPTPAPESAPTSHPAQDTERGIGGGTILAELITPRLRALATKLELARHSTTLDERVGQNPPTVRFRIRPWTGPFDTFNESGAVIEFVEIDGDDGPLVARLWLDPLHANASHECDLSRAGLDGSRVDRLLLDFLGKVLQR